MSKVMVIHGDDDDAMYVSDDCRRCGSCDKIKPIKSFRQSQKRVSIDCKECLKDSTEVNAIATQASSDDLLATALARATGRRTLMEATLKFPDGVKSVFTHLGGEDAAYKRIAGSMGRALDDENADVGRKAAMGLLGIVALAEKQAGDPIDLSELSDEDRMMILMEPAKQLILSSMEFRRLLLNDPEIRGALLSEAGVDVLETVNG